MKTTEFIVEYTGIGADAEAMHEDHEVQLARQSCYHAARDAIALHHILKDVSEQQGLEGWVSEKITLAASYLNDVIEHLEAQRGGDGEAGMTDIMNAFNMESAEALYNQLLSESESHPDEVEDKKLIKKMVKKDALKKDPVNELDASTMQAYLQKRKESPMPRTMHKAGVQAAGVRNAKEKIHDKQVTQAAKQTGRIAEGADSPEAFKTAKGDVIRLGSIDYLFAMETGRWYTRRNDYKAGRDIAPKWMPTRDVPDSVRAALPDDEIDEGASDLTDIWQAGKEAAYMGKGLSSCPYKMFSREHNAWQQGYQDQKENNIQGMSEGKYDPAKDTFNPETHAAVTKDGKDKIIKKSVLAKYKEQGWKERHSLKAFHGNRANQGVMEAFKEVPTHGKTGKPNPNHPNFAKHDAEYKAKQKAMRPPRAPAAPKLTLNDVWRKVEDVVGQVFPDGDPIDWLIPWFNRQGIDGHKIGAILEKAARANGYKDIYDYWNQLKAQMDADAAYDAQMGESQVTELSAGKLQSYRTLATKSEHAAELNNNGDRADKRLAGRNAATARLNGMSKAPAAYKKPVAENASAGGTSAGAMAAGPTGAANKPGTGKPKDLGNKVKRAKIQLGKGVY
jgi:hypothetical protein